MRWHLYCLNVIVHLCYTQNVNSHYGFHISCWQWRHGLGCYCCRCPVWLSLSSIVLPHSSSSFIQIELDYETIVSIPQLWNHIIGQMTSCCRPTLECSIKYSVSVAMAVPAFSIYDNFFEFLAWTIKARNFLIQLLLVHLNHTGRSLVQMKNRWYEMVS